MKWFRHDTDMHQNPKIKKLIRTHGATGYAFWSVLLEKLYKAEEEFQIIADELWFEDIAEDLKLGDHRTPIRILDTLSQMGLIDPQLWAEHIIFAPAIAKRGDEYIVKRVQETEKKRRYREKQKAMSTVDTEGTKGQSAVLSPSDPDLIVHSSEFKDQTHTQSEKEKGKPTKKNQSEPVRAEVEIAKPIAPPVDRIAQLYSAELPEWRTAPGRNGINQQFLEWISTSYLPKVPSYEKRTVTVGDAKMWVLSRERDEAGRQAIGVQWDEFSCKQTQPGVATTHSAYDWSQDARCYEWARLFSQVGLWAFTHPDGTTSSPERHAFLFWLEDHPEFQEAIA